MTMHARKIIAAPSAVKIFQAHAQARALLYPTGEFDLHGAVDALQEAAVATGLVNEIGQDAVQAILAEAFGGVCR
jgi:hypothetical protein